MTRTITGLFDDRASAEAVVNHLVTHDGIDRSRVTIHGTDAGSTAGAATSSEENGFWASLKSLFVPDEDRYAYSEGIRRGGVVLSAEVDESQITHAMDVFEEHGAVDLDSREAEWRSSGWKGYEDMATTKATSSGSASAGMTGTDATGMGMAGGVAGAGLAGMGTTPSIATAGTMAAPAATTNSDMTDPGVTQANLTSTGLTSTGLTDASLTGAGTVGAGTATGAHTATGTGLGATGSMPTGLPSGGTASGRVEDSGVIPVVEEQLHISKRDREHGRVRVRAYVTERPVSEQVSLREERVDVERRPVDRPLTDADNAFRETTIEAVEHREEAVVSKEARIVEEVVLHKDATQRTETVEDTVRRQDVEVEDTRTGKTAGLTDKTTTTPRV
jgi:uncharacterized protein (TIGR02271 family)